MNALINDSPSLSNKSMNNSIEYFDELILDSCIESNMNRIEEDEDIYQELLGFKTSATRNIIINLNKASKNIDISENKSKNN